MLEVPTSVELDELAMEISLATVAVCSKIGFIASCPWMTFGSSWPYGSLVAGLGRKYVDMGACPEYATWNGMRLGMHSETVSSGLLNTRAGAAAMVQI